MYRSLFFRLLGLWTVLLSLLLPACQEQASSPFVPEEVIGLAEMGDLSAANKRLAQLSALPALSHSDSMRIAVLCFMLKYKAYENVSQDRYILQAWAYFKAQEPKSLYCSLAGFYAAGFYKEIGDRDMGLRILLETAEQAKQYAHRDIAGKAYHNIAAYYSNRFNTSKALQYYQLALANYQAQGNRRLQMQVYQNLGQVFLYKAQTDSALRYYNIAVAMAQNINDSVQVARIFNDIGVVYKQKGNYAQQLHYLYQALVLERDSTARMRVYTNISNAYLNLAAYDSAAAYMQRAKKMFPACHDAYLAASVYKQQTRLDLATHNYGAVATNFAAYSHVYDSIAKVLNKQAQDKIAAEFEHELVQSHLATSEQQLMFYSYILWVGIPLFVLLLVVLYIWWRKNKQLRYTKQQLAASEHKAKQLVQKAEAAAAAAKNTAQHKSKEAQLAQLKLDKEQQDLLLAQQQAKIQAKEAALQIKKAQDLQAALETERLPMAEANFLREYYKQLSAFGLQLYRQQQEWPYLPKANTNKQLDQILTYVANTKKDYQLFIDNLSVHIDTFLKSKDITLHDMPLKNNYALLLALLNTSLPCTEIQQLLNINSEQAFRSKRHRLKQKLMELNIPESTVEQWVIAKGK